MSESDELSAVLTDNSEEMSPCEGSPTVLKFYTLSFLRFRNLVFLVLFIDGVGTLALWLTGGHTDYFVDNILHFHILNSVFDLAVMTSVKVILLWSLYTLLEDSTMMHVEDPYNKKLRGRIHAYHVTIVMVTLTTLAYSLVKGGLILNAYLNEESFESLHLPYYIVCIACVTFGLLELVLSLYSFKAMRRLKVQRVLNRININGQHLDEEGNVIKQKTNIRRLLALAKPELPYICSAVFFLFISSATETVSPLFFGIVVDAAVTSMAALNRAVLILMTIYFVGAFASAFRAGLFTLAGQSLVARLRKHVFLSIIRQEIAFFDVTRTGELTNRLASDTTVIQNAVTVNISMLARYLLTILGSIGLMFYLNASLTGVLLAVIPVITLGAVQYGRFLQSLQKQFQDQLADASTVAEENISSMRTVRSFSGEGKAGAMYSAEVERSFQTGKKLAIIQGAFQGFTGVFISGAITLALWYGGKLVHEKTITPGILTSFLLYSLQVALSFGILSSLYGDFMKAVGASVRIFDLMDRKPTVGTEENLEIPRTFDSSVEFRNVKFSYPSRPENQVLKGVSFSVARGQMIALVGPSGGGKSTIVNLIQRFYDPDQGVVLLGSHNVIALDTAYMRSRMSMVSQEPSLFACSIKENITYGREAKTIEEVIAVATQANAHDFISSFENGYETLVGEKGIRLSGGQKQRVAIARALMMDPDILLLDEATSALDAESEQQVQEAIDNAMQNRTVLVIAHRLSTVRNAHKILVLDQGEIVESGTHEELVAMEGVYKRLVLRQLNAGESNTNGIDGEKSGQSGGDNTEVVCRSEEESGTIGVSAEDTTAAD